MKKFAAVFLSFALLIAAFGCAEKPDDPGREEPDPAQIQAEVNGKLSGLDDQAFTLAQLCGTDDLGRTVSPLVGFNDKYVGLFYFVATGQIAAQGVYHHDKIYDISKLLEAYPDRGLMDNPVTAVSTGPTAQYYDPAISPEGDAHFWDEPLYGYYRSDDPWVIRRHLELFTNAGIDFLYLDYTNNIIFETATWALLDVMLDMQAEGYDVPKLTFFLSPKSDNAKSTFEDQVIPAYFYTEKYESCWFRADEEMNPSQKPMVVGNWDSYSANDRMRQKYWLKQIQWPTNNAAALNPDAIPWTDWAVKQFNHNGIMNVSVSQGGSPSSEAYFQMGLDYRARGWTPDKMLEYGTEEADVLAGANFEYQWGNALASKNELKMVTVSGWNEWIVRKLEPDDPASNVEDRGIYVDSFSMAYSRDAEMMKGGYGDNYYMQMVRNIRSFKGVTVADSDNVALFDKKTINISDISAWEGSAKYLDLGLGTVERDCTAVDRSIPYRDDTNRNDIEYLKICNDGQNLYVAVTVRGENITEYEAGDSSWMNLYLSCGGAGWAGYDFIVGRSPDPSTGQTSVERLSAEGTAEDAGRASYFKSGKTIVYSIPLSALGVSERMVIGVKAADHLQKMCDADEFYLSGDCAPMGRLNYAYKIA